MKFKKRLAVLLTAAMVMSMSVPTMATTLSTNEVPGGDNRTGIGSIEAHLDKEVANIILPTISSDAFDFTVDPERLVQATHAAKYIEAGYSVEDDAQDAGVFFLVSDNKYDSKTPEFEFENRSSFAIDLTVQVEAKHYSEATDLPLLSDNQLARSTTPGLFLGLKVGKDDDDFSAVKGDPIKYDAITKKTVSVNGVSTNFIVSWNSADGYHNIEKDSPDTWSKGKFQVEGEATSGKDIEENTSAPTIEVTWSWKKYGALEPNKIVFDGTTIFVKLFEDTSSVVADKLGTVKVNNVAKTAEVTAAGVIKLVDAAPTAGEYIVSVVYDGNTYVGSGKK